HDPSSSNCCALRRFPCSVDISVCVPESLRIVCGIVLVLYAQSEAVCVRFRLHSLRFFRRTLSPCRPAFLLCFRVFPLSARPSFPVPFWGSFPFRVIHHTFGWTSPPNPHCISRSLYARQTYIYWHSPQSWSHQ